MFIVLLFYCFFFCSHIFFSFIPCSSLIIFPSKCGKLTPLLRYIILFFVVLLDIVMQVCLLCNIWSSSVFSYLSVKFILCDLLFQYTCRECDLVTDKMLLLLGALFDVVMESCLWHAVFEASPYFSHFFPYRSSFDLLFVFPTGARKWPFIALSLWGFANCRVQSTRLKVLLNNWLPPQAEHQVREYAFLFV